MNIKKFPKKSFQGLLLHCDRTFKNHSNESIDITKSNLNYNVSENKKSAKEVLEFAQSHMRGGKKIRDNINVVVGACVTLPKGIDTNNKDERELFFQASYEFLKWRYCQGKEERIVSSFVHLDETTPHMHFLFVPIDENNYLSAKNLITKKDLQSLHQDYSKTMTSIFQRDIEVMNGITKKRGNLELKELKRISEEKDKLAEEKLQKVRENLKTKISKLKREEKKLLEKINQEKITTLFQFETRMKEVLGEELFSELLAFSYDDFVKPYRVLRNRKANSLKKLWENDIKAVSRKKTSNFVMKDKFWTKKS